jgi:hypothetical protein
MIERIGLLDTGPLLSSLAAVLENHATGAGGSPCSDAAVPQSTNVIAPAHAWSGFLSFTAPPKS